MENPQTSPIVPTPAPARPTFLTVLCILTFLGSAYGIFSGISTYMNANVTASIVGDKMEEAKEQIKEDASGSDSKLAENLVSGMSNLMDPARLKKNALFMIAANILTLFGAFLMFQLKKIGFWVYLLGTALGILAPILVYGVTNIFSLGMTIFIGFFGILFVILYAVNLKYLR